jgi:hypothetical protein
MCVDQGSPSCPLELPGINLGYQVLAFVDTASQALTAQLADFDFYHVEPPRMFRCVMELQALRNMVYPGRGEGFDKAPAMRVERLFITTRI